MPRATVRMMIRLVTIAALATAMGGLFGCTRPPSTATQTAATPAQAFDVKAHYDKAEYRIPMRDGVKLYTVVYTPKDQSKKYPFLLFRSPYGSGPYGPDEYRAPSRLAPSEEFLRDGYIFVLQDGRGTYNSEGDWVNLKPIAEKEGETDESTDTYDAIEWLIHNVPNNNGRVGQWGISHPGWYTVMGMVKPHPALKAASPQATTFDPFIGDDNHRNGVFRIIGVEWWYTQSVISGPGHEKLNGKAPDPIDFGTPWDYEFFLNAGPTDELNERHFGGKLTREWQNLIEHPNYDAYWKSLNVARSLGHITVPVLNVGGWFDAPDPYGSVATYQEIEKRNPTNTSTLVMGPWRHGGWVRDDGSHLGDFQFGSKTSEYFQRNILFPFFQHYLKDQGDWSPAEAIVFETGANRWHRFDQWPPPGVTKKNLYFGKSGTLSFTAPAEKGAAAQDSYVSDPAKPVPYTAEIRRNWGFEFYAGDQRYASTRPDVLTYQTEVLKEDVTIAGPTLAKLFVSTTGTDSDWFVKLIDVYPGDAPNNEEGPKAAKMGGYQVLLGIEAMRGRYRNDLSKPEPMVPGKLTPVSFNIWDKFHTFKKGHRIMVHLHSTWFPVFDRNPQTFVENIYRAKPEQYRKATQTVYRSVEAPSHLVLPVVEGPLR